MNKKYFKNIYRTFIIILKGAYHYIDLATDILLVILFY